MPWFYTGPCLMFNSHCTAFFNWKCRGPLVTTWTTSGHVASGWIFVAQSKFYNLKNLWWILVWLCYYETYINYLINMIFWPWALLSASVHPWIFKTKQNRTEQNKTKTSLCCFIAVKEDSNISSYLCPNGFLFFFFKFPPLFQVPHVEE